MAVNPIPDGSIAHAQVQIGSSAVMVGGARDEWKALPMFMHLYVPDADAVYAQAIAAGATSMQEPMDEFYGDRTSGVKDPFGNLWWLATHQEDVPPRRSRSAWPPRAERRAGSRATRWRGSLPGRRPARPRCRRAAPDGAGRSGRR
jgi:hypothetical protein